MGKFIAILGLLIIGIGPAWANSQNDARICYRGTKTPTAEHVNYCTRAIKSGTLSNRDMAMTHNNRGAIFLALGDQNAALDDFARALEINPRLVRAYQSRGMILLGRNDYKGAWNDFNKAIAVAPRSSRGYVNRSLVYIKTKQYDVALQDLERALGFNRKDALAYNNRAVIYFLTGKAELAHAASVRSIGYGIDKYIIQRKLAPGMYQGRVNYFMKRGQYRDALNDLNKLVRIRPDIAWPHNDRAWLLATAPIAKWRNGMEAVNSAVTAIGLADTHQHRDTLAAAYAEVGNFKAATAEQQRAITMARNAGDKPSVAKYKRILADYFKQKPRRMAPVKK